MKKSSPFLSRLTKVPSLLFKTSNLEKSLSEILRLILRPVNNPLEELSLWTPSLSFLRHNLCPPLPVTTFGLFSELSSTF